MTLAAFLIFGLATWRISNLFVWEAGPFDVFLRIRQVAGITHGVDKVPFQIPDNFLAQLLSCVWCASVWIAIFWAVFWFLSPTAIWFALPFALSSVAILIDKRMK